LATAIEKEEKEELPLVIEDEYVRILEDLELMAEERIKSLREVSSQLNTENEARNFD
jgi:hypothetical protein